MLETLHELIYGMRFIVLIVALLGIGYALVLFYRAFEVFNQEKTQKELEKRKKRRSRQGQKSPGPESRANRSTVHLADPVDSTEKATVLIEDEPQTELTPPPPVAGDQIDLLSNLPDDSLGNASDAETKESAPITAEIDNPIGDNKLVQGKGVSTKSNYGIDQHARTRHDLKSPEDTKRYAINDQITTAINQNLGEDSADALTDRVDEAARPEPTVDNDDDALLRRASRMEELGFHVGIVPEQLRQAPDRVSNEEKEELLRTLGLLEQKAKDAHLLSDDDLKSKRETASDKDDEIDLDAILANLDKALDGKFEPENETISYREQSVHGDEAASATNRSDVKTERIPEDDEPHEEDEPPSENNIETEVLDAKASTPDSGIDAGIAASLAQHTDNTEPQEPEESATEPDAPEPSADKTEPQAEKSPAPKNMDDQPFWARADIFDEDVDNK